MHRKTMNFFLDILSLRCPSDNHMKIQNMKEVTQTNLEIEMAGF